MCDKLFECCDDLWISLSIISVGSNTRPYSLCINITYVYITILIVQSIFAYFACMFKPARYVFQILAVRLCTLFIYHWFNSCIVLWCNHKKNYDPPLPPDIKSWFSMLVCNVFQYRCHYIVRFTSDHNGLTSVCTLQL